jgi:hypothetical protein
LSCSTQESGLFQKDERKGEKKKKKEKPKIKNDMKISIFLKAVRQTGGDTGI